MNSSPSISLVLPATWRVLDLDPATRDRYAERVARQIVGSGDRWALYRRWAVKSYRQMAGEASEAGAFFAASYAEKVAGYVVAATLMVFVGMSPVEQPDELGPALDDVGKGEVLVDPARPVELRVGPAVRSRVRVAAGVPDSGGRTLPVDVTRFFVPVPASDRLMVMAFSTPILPVADALAELFDQVAMTVRWRE